MSTADILTHSVFLLIVLISQVLLAKGIYGLIKCRGNYSFKKIWTCSVYLHGVIILTLLYIKLLIKL